MLGAPGTENLGERNQGRGCSLALVGKSLTRGKTRTRKRTPKTDVGPLARNGSTTQLHHGDERDNNISYLKFCLDLYRKLPVCAVLEPQVSQEFNISTLTTL